MSARYPCKSPRKPYRGALLIRKPLPLGSKPPLAPPPRCVEMGGGGEARVCVGGGGALGVAYSKKSEAKEQSSHTLPK